MKKPRYVAIPDEPLTHDTKAELLTHAINSLTWYCTQRYMTAPQLRVKLVDKGYPDRDVAFHNEYTNSVEHVHFIDAAIQHCDDLKLVVADSTYIHNMIHDAAESGKSPMEARHKLFTKQYVSDDVDEYMNHYPLEHALSVAYTKALRTSSVRKATDHDRESHIITYLLRKGFRYSDIIEHINNGFEEIS